MKANSPTKSQAIAAGAFAEKIADDFSAGYALSLLRRSAPLPSGVRECVLSALSAWVLAPRDDGLRLDAISAAARSYLAKVEKPVVRTGRDKDYVKPMANMLLARTFYEEIYYPLGGVTAISNARTPEAVGARLKRERTSLDRALAVLRIGHWIKEQDSQRFLAPSIERSSAAASLLVNPRRTPRSIKNDWNKHQDSIAI